jgi:hypothetical protein
MPFTTDVIYNTSASHNSPLPSSPNLSADAKPLKGCALEAAIIMVEDYIMGEYHADKSYQAARRRFTFSGNRLRDHESKMREYEEGQEWRFNKRNEWHVVRTRAGSV